jgi:glutamyl-tRNA reductase
MSELTARNLRSRGATIVAVANRTLEHGEELARQVGARAIGLESLAGVLADADVVVASTGAPGFVVGPGGAAGALRARRGRPILFVDLAVPRDVDPALSGVDGCFVYDIDDLEAVVETSLAGRRAEAVRAERIVATEAERFREWQASLAVVPDRVPPSSEEIAPELAKAEAAGAAAEGDRKLRGAVTSQIVAKLLHLPTSAKEAALPPTEWSMLTPCGTCSVWARRSSSRDPTVPDRAPAAAAGTHRVRAHPPARPPRVRRDPDSLPSPLPCCCASVPAAVGSRSPRPSAPRTRCAGPEWRSLSFP